MAAKKSIKPSSIYQLKISLKDSKPPIWRRVLVPSDIKLSILHRVIQIAMGWEDYHLHNFNIGRINYGVPDADFIDDFDTQDENKFKLDQLIVTPKSKFLYEYDFGDSWMHDIVLEKIFPPEENKIYPVCIKGVRACPPEDCGGVWGYGDMLESLAHPNEDTEESLEWLGDDFDPEAFDIDEVNQELKSLA